MKSNTMLRAFSLLILLISLFPSSHADALVSAAPPPVDMFQLPWDQGIAWYAIDGIDNGSKRPASSSHNYRLGGAIDFAPRTNMVTGENTSNFWVAAAASGTVVATSSCYVSIAHENGWLTQYQFLGNIQVKLGDVVTRNQRLGIIADGVKYKYCAGYQEINVPHVHFMLRPSTIGASFAGWEVKYNSLFNSTTFTKNGQTVGLRKLLMNVMDAAPTPSPTPTLTTLPPTATSTPPSGPYVSTVTELSNIDVGQSAVVSVRLNNVPTEGYTSAEFTCPYNASLVEVSNIVFADRFGPDPVTAINGPQNGSFIAAIAGTSGSKATTNGVVFSFDVKGLQAGQIVLDCTARVSTGNNVLVSIPSVGTSITILGDLATPMPSPTVTPGTEPPPIDTPTASPPVCDKAEFIAHVNVPPGTQFFPGVQFTKTWRLQNAGTCTWTNSYQLVFFSGEQMSAVPSAFFPASVAPGQTVDLSINMTAPSVPGPYRGYWMFKNSNGALFGTGPGANEPWFVDINVIDSTGTPLPTFTPSSTPGGPSLTPTVSVTPGGPTATPVAGVAYDFASNACTAVWVSGAGQLPCPGIDGDAKGFVLLVSNPRLESGATDTRTGLITFPQNVQNGYIQGLYPAIRVQSGDRFRSTIGCEFGATTCYVAFRLDYQVGSDPIKTFWGPFLERYEGQDYSVDVDLSSLAGKDVKFILTVLATGDASGDRASWVGPILYRAGAVSTPDSATATPGGPTQTAVPTSSTPGSDWLGFLNVKYQFTLRHPFDSQLLDGSTDNYARINLPFVQGTNLREKYLEVIVAENVSVCESPLAASSMPQSSETVVISGITFLKQTGSDGAAGSLFQWVAYSTSRDNACVSLNFVLRSLNPGNFPTPPPTFDFAAESLVFGQIVSTYSWLTIAPTTSTPTTVPTATGSPVPGFTPTPGSSPTPSGGNAAVAGQITASRPVIVNVYDTNTILVATMETNPDGSFRLEVLPGTYTVVAISQGCLRTQATETINAGVTRVLPSITLLTGDIDANNVIDQFDALTIGMSYNLSIPEAADLNNDGIINVLDLELLARNYRETGPVAWQ